MNSVEEIPRPLKKERIFMSTKNIIRILLVVLILLNLWMIFNFSSESAEKSGETSKKVTTTVAQTIVKDFEDKPPHEQALIIFNLHPSVRTLAHMTEFGLLGVWVMLLLLTYRIRPLFSALWAVLSTLLKQPTNRSFLLW